MNGPDSPDRGPALRPILRVGISTRALFDVAEEHRVFENDGPAAYGSLQRSREGEPMRAGRGLDLVRGLLDLNAPGEPAVVEAILLSRNPPEVAIRAFASIAHHGLAITVGSFTGGRSLAPQVAAWDIDLFLSDDFEDVAAVIAGGAAAARLSDAPARTGAIGRELRVALDGDAVVFDDEAAMIHEELGLAAFLSHEAEKAGSAMGRGPFAGILEKLALLRLQALCRVDGPRVRIALVTARCAPAHARALETLRAWGVEVDEAHFTGGRSKAATLAAYDAHIFFDDMEHHVIEAPSSVTAALVFDARRSTSRRSPAMMMTARDGHASTEDGNRRS